MQYYAIQSILYSSVAIIDGGEKCNDILGGIVVRKKLKFIVVQLSTVVTKFDSPKINKTSNFSFSFSLPYPRSCHPARE